MEVRSWDKDAKIVGRRVILPLDRTSQTRGHVTVHCVREYLSVDWLKQPRPTLIHSDTPFSI